MGGRELMRGSLVCAFGHAGDSEAVGAGVYELRIHYGPGYRVYFAIDSEYVFLLLCGGAKGKQSADIARAQSHWSEHQGRAKKERSENAKKKKS